MNDFNYLVQSVNRMRAVAGWVPPIKVVTVDPKRPWSLHISVDSVADHKNLVGAAFQAIASIDDRKGMIHRCRFPLRKQNTPRFPDTWI